MTGLESGQEGWNRTNVCRDTAGRSATDLPLDLSGARSGARTHDLLLGKQALYQLSYPRISLTWGSIGGALVPASSGFVGSPAALALTFSTVWTWPLSASSQVS